MRVITSIIVALCAVLAGAQPREIETRDPQSSQVVVAPPAVVAAATTRRAGIDAHLRPLVYIASAAAEPAAPPARAWIDEAEQAPSSPTDTVVATRSSRGPPRSSSHVADHCNHNNRGSHAIR